jgi:uncharacterized protein (TIGR00725 family)
VAFDHEVATVAAQLPEGTRVAIIGSTSFWHAESQATCEAIGRLLAALDDVVLLTGGVAGIGEAVGRSFFGARSGRDAPRGVFHVLPHGNRQWDYGQTVFVGSDMGERREVLGRLAECYVVIEGGPGTAHEASVALRRSVCVVPVGRSGGYARELYPQVRRPPFASESAWHDLALPTASPGVVAEAVASVVGAHLRQLRHDVKSTARFPR